MPPIISELIKFSVAHGFKLDSPSFSMLRKSVVANGVKEQYYGTCTDTPNTLFWVIRAYLFFSPVSPGARSYLYGKNGVRIRAPWNRPSSEMMSRLWT
jgi:hypothetical protein